MIYRISFSDDALAFLEEVGDKHRRQILRKILGLEQNPRQGGIRLVNTEHLWRIRAGDYRIIYQIEDEWVQVLILFISRRDEHTYNPARLRRLDQT